MYVVLRVCARVYLKLGISADCRSHLTGVVKELGLMRVQLVRVLRGVQPNIFASHYLTEGIPNR